jgi:hypothetical protein
MKTPRMQDKGKHAVGCDPKARETPDLEVRTVVPMPVLRHTPLQAACSHDQVDRAAEDYAVQVGAS